MRLGPPTKCTTVHNGGFAHKRGHKATNGTAPAWFTVVDPMRFHPAVEELGDSLMEEGGVLFFPEAALREWLGKIKPRSRAEIRTICVDLVRFVMEAQRICGAASARLIEEITELYLKLSQVEPVRPVRLFQTDEVTTAHAQSTALLPRWDEAAPTGSETVARLMRARVRVTLGSTSSLFWDARFHTRRVD